MTPAEAIDVARQALVESDEPDAPIMPWGYLLRDADGYVVPVGGDIDDSRLLVHNDGEWEWQTTFEDQDRVDAMEAIDAEGKPVDLNNLGGQSSE